MQLFTYYLYIDRVIALAIHVCVLVFMRLHDGNMCSIDYPQYVWHACCIIKPKISAFSLELIHIIHFLKLSSLFICLWKFYTIFHKMANNYVGNNFYASTYCSLAYCIH